MRSVLERRCLSAFAFAVTLLTLLASCAPQLFAQGGEPEYFAIRGAKIVPVSGPPVEGATIVMAHGIITAIGKDVAIPPDAWVIEGKGLTVYPGLFDSFTDVGIPSAPRGTGRRRRRRPSPPSNAGNFSRSRRPPRDHALEERGRRSQPQRQAHRVLARSRFYDCRLRAQGRHVPRPSFHSRSRRRSRQ